MPTFGPTKASLTFSSMVGIMNVQPMQIRTKTPTSCRKKAMALKKIRDGDPSYRRKAMALTKIRDGEQKQH
jgi:hypothetical protein